MTDDSMGGDWLAEQAILSKMDSKPMTEARPSEKRPDAEKKASKREPTIPVDQPPRKGRQEAETKKGRSRIRKKVYERELAKLQVELVKLQEWIKFAGLKVVVVFEGRDAAGKGGVITRITQSLNPRIVRVVALPAPTERERSQWYFQRYVAHLPAAGEMVLFDRSWYNRAGVERVMGFCSDEAYREFLRSCPEFERMLVRSGIILIKYWFSVSDEEQERRFQARIVDPTKRWKLSPMDLESRSRWIEYSRAKDEMFKYTDIKQAPWYVVNADIKMHARLNCIRHLLSMIPYKDLTPEPIALPPRQDDIGYVRPPITDQTFVPEHYGAETT
jgi:polyphosphate kinase 2